MGGSMPVPLNMRIPFWLETVTALLSKLDVDRVNLVSHSAGTAYAMNTLYHLRDILDPRAPYMGFIAPWVFPNHSNATLMNLVTKIPSGVMESWNSVAGFVNQRLEPTAAWSGGIFSSAVGIFQAEQGKADLESTPLSKKYGTSEEVGKEIEKLMMKYLFKEDTTGANDEAKQCAKKAGSDWGVCDEYDDFVQKLVKREQERTGSDAGRPKLKVRAYFAESDVMIGKRGGEYFGNCWRQDGVSDSIDFDDKVLSGTNHDTALQDHERGALKNIIADIKSQIQSS